LWKEKKIMAAYVGLPELNELKDTGATSLVEQPTAAYTLITNVAVQE